MFILAFLQLKTINQIVKSYYQRKVREESDRCGQVICDKNGGGGTSKILYKWVQKYTLVILVDAKSCFFYIKQLQNILILLKVTEKSKFETPHMQPWLRLQEQWWIMKGLSICDPSVFDWGCYGDNIWMVNKRIRMTLVIYGGFRKFLFCQKERRSPKKK